MKLGTTTRAILLLTASIMFVCPRPGSTAPKPRLILSSASETQTRPRRGAPTQKKRRPAQARRQARSGSYTNFSHRTREHQQACDSCHTIPTPNWTRVREREDAFPDVADYPDHPSCVNCHRQQFFSGARPAICTVCHTNVSPRDSARHPFQNPSENFASAKKKVKEASEFRLNFPHDRHQDVMARFRSIPESGARADFIRVSALWQGSVPKKIDSCSICHETFQPQGEGDEKFVVKPPDDLARGAFWLKKGTFKITPSNHASCFNCHWQGGGEQPLSSDCAGCHKLSTHAQDDLHAARAHKDFDPALAAAMGVSDKSILEKWMRRQAATFRHEQTKHENVGCTSCHIQISAINVLDENTLSVPLLTCGGGGTGCHIKGSVPKGILNNEVDKRNADATFQCTKCHLNYGRDPVPKTHTDAVTPAAKAK